MAAVVGAAEVVAAVMMGTAVVTAGSRPPAPVAAKSLYVSLVKSSTHIAGPTGVMSQLSSMHGSPRLPGAGAGAVPGQRAVAAWHCAVQVLPTTAW